MRASELKKELRERGVSTAALFEKSELVQALAQARVDGKTGSGSSSSDGEGYAEYANVEVVTDDSGPQKRSQQREQQESQAPPNPFGGAGGNPFGGGGMPGGMGGMGGMGGIADLLKNMGGGGGAPGGNPFGGGAGGNPFGGMGGMGGMGDAMGKAQELMKNPKIMQLMAKAQSNPRIMTIMNECMSNPAALKKYENDPELKEIIEEMKKIM